MRSKRPSPTASMVEQLPKVTVGLLRQSVSVEGGGEVKLNDEDTRITGLIFTGLICLTVICCIALMASCDKVREQEHTKQRLGGVTNAAEHMHLP